jgi:hypothetical protein
MSTLTVCIRYQVTVKTTNDFPTKHIEKDTIDCVLHLNKYENKMKTPTYSYKMFDAPQEYTKSHALIALMMEAARTSETLVNF